MRILLIMDPGIPVPPEFYGGHERLVYLFAQEYQRLGHTVTLLAGPQSYCSGKTITFGKNDLNRPKSDQNTEILFAWRFLWANRRNFDMVHNFGRLVYLFPILNSPIKKVMTYGRKVTPSGIKLINKFPNKNIIFTACSNYCVATGNVAGKWVTVYNTIDFSQYDLNETVNDNAPIMFLGRLDKIKGAHTAISVAKATKNQMIIAGNISHTPGNYAYFKNEIEPLIDGEQIKYVGALNDEEKNKYLKQAKALLFPIEWGEPFGMVMIEAMACGTPVIAFNRGAVPEVIENNVTGFIVNSEAEMIKKVAQLPALNRRACRETSEKKFGLEKTALHYLSLFN